MYSKILLFFMSMFRKKPTSRLYFPWYVFPVIDLMPRPRKIARKFVQKAKKPYVKQSAFVNGFPVFTVEEEAFEYLKANHYLDADVNTLEDYKKNCKKYRYQVWGVRVLNVHRTSGYFHDPNFPVLYFVVDKYYQYVSNRLSDDIRHWYTRYIHEHYSKETIDEWNETHKILAKNPKADWHQNINPTRRTIK